MTVAGADEIVRAVQAGGVRFFSGESGYRITGTFQQIKRWVDEGRIGRVISAYTVLRSPLPTQPWPGEQGRTWWLDPTKSPGGGWIDHAIYHVDFLRWLLGDEVERIGGEVANLKYPDVAPLEDFGVATLRFRGGAVAIVEVTWTGQPGAGLNQIHLVGTEGQIVWDPALSGKVALLGRSDPGGWLLTGGAARDSNIGEHMFDAIEGKALAATAEDARTNLAVCEAFYRAARDGRAVTL
jgi:predicted dehydrogenase